MRRRRSGLPGDFAPVIGGPPCAAIAWPTLIQQTIGSTPNALRAAALLATIALLAQHFPAVTQVGALAVGALSRKDAR